MKQIITLTSLMLALCCLCSCEPSVPQKISDVTITNSYINDLGRKVFVLSDGGMAEIIIREADKYDAVQFYDKNYNQLFEHRQNSCLSLRAQNFTKWLNAEVGGQAVLVKNRKRYYYEIVIGPDFSVERKVTRISKYDGNLNKINGSIELGVLLGSGELEGEGMGCKNMFINVYFEDRAPITVNAKENQLWLDVEVGTTVIEKRINGKTYFTPKF